MFSNLQACVKYALSPASKRFSTSCYRLTLTKTVASIQNRTRSLLQAVRTSQNNQSTLTRLRAFNDHILEYLNVGRSEAIREGGLKTALEIRRRENPELRKEARKTLALLGWVDPVKGAGIRVLSIDGGGSRGIVPIEILKRIEDLCNKEIYQLFDFICGSSTGAILAFLVGIRRMPLAECEYVYKNLSIDLFERNTLIGTGKLFWSHAFYETEKLEEILRTNSGSDKRLIDTAADKTIPKVAAVSTLVNQQVLKPYVFCNYTHPFESRPRFPSSCKYKLWEALRASCAAPGFFEECKLDNNIHQDGGLLTNNPSAVAVHEARLLWPDTPFQCILSLGTGLCKGREDQFVGSFSSLRQKLLKVVASATDTEAVDTVLSDLLPRNTYFRFNPNLAEDVPMDECRLEVLEQVQVDTRKYLDKNQTRLTNARHALLQEKSFSQQLRDKWHTWHEPENM
ncbi:calcium-independent phospholipase A2-gamma [Nematostella vectensis]|uniref:calcium-independent phospholipase A2-gamma n=1 Tax=Nematostella vectensis TaxID=45351 RepID=UPI0020774274|nr:calcium-independent phospholipase A2-gamma [Nematostella vectensis]